MLDPNEAVIPEEQPAAPEVQETPTTETQEVEETPAPQPVEELDDRGVPWKNRAMELERKLNDMPSIIQKTVEESLLKQNKPQEPQYTVEEIEAWAIANPQYKAQAERMKHDLLLKNLEKIQDAKLQQLSEQQKHQSIRQQSEAWVTSHPKFKDCFTTDFTGNKNWNMSNPLTQMMANILNQPDPITGKLVKDRPDGIAVAAEIAYGRYLLNNEPKAKNTVEKLKKDLRNVQKKTLVEGGGVTPQVASKGSVGKALDNYSKTYSTNDIKDATKAFLVGKGILKEE